MELWQKAFVHLFPYGDGVFALERRKQLSFQHWSLMMLLRTELVHTGCGGRHSACVSGDAAMVDTQVAQKACVGKPISNSNVFSMTLGDEWSWYAKRRQDGAQMSECLVALKMTPGAK